MANPTAHSALGWVSVRHLQHIIARGEASGIGMDELLQAAGLSRSLLADGENRVPVAALESMLTTLVQRHPDPLVGLHLAEDIQPATFGALGFILQTCLTFGDMVQTLIRYNGLLSNIGTTSLRRGPGTVQLCWECSAGGEAFRVQAAEYVMGAIVVIARLLLPERHDLFRSVGFADSRQLTPVQQRQYAAFFRCPVYFGQSVSALTLPLSVLDIKMPHGDAFMKDVLERHAHNLLQQRNQSASLVQDVTHLLHAMLADGVPGREAVAAQLGLSGRSLHRKLQEAGTSYRAVLDQVRLQVARQRLVAGTQPLAGIAANLGFATYQSFLRWFRPLMGQTPAEYRAGAGIFPLQEDDTHV